MPDITATASHWSWRGSLAPGWWRPVTGFGPSHLAVVEIRQTVYYLHFSISTLSTSPPFSRILYPNCLTRPRAILSSFLRKTDHIARKKSWQLYSGLIEILRSTHFYWLERDDDNNINKTGRFIVSYSLKSLKEFKRMKCMERKIWRERCVYTSALEQLCNTKVIPGPGAGSSDSVSVSLVLYSSI